MSSFVHLHVHSHYSLLDGLTRIDELVAAAKADHQPALALTDHGTLYGAIEFSQACRKAGVKPIIGMEAYLAPRSRFDREKQVDERAYSHLVLLAKNRTGYQNLLQLTTLAHLEGYYYKPRIDWELLGRYGDGLIALTACLGGEIPRLITARDDDVLEVAIARYRDRFGGDFYLELQHRNDIPESRIVNARLIELGKRHGIPIVATNDIHYLTPEDAEAHDVLLCLQTKSKQQDQGRLRMLGEHYGFRTAKEMALLFEDYPEAIANTVRIADSCGLELELGKIQLPSFPIPKSSTYDAELSAACEERFAKRYGSASPDRQREARTRMAYELKVIAEMGYASYFLIVADFVNWAKQHGVVVGPGRGSAAGSIVSYLCNITNLDPLAYDLLFERFLAPGRVQMPDIDLDFADHRRDEVLAYVRAKYGEDHVAQIITFGTMAARAVIRDVGRVLDVPYQFCDRLAKLIPFGSSLDDALRDVAELRELVEGDETTQRLFAIARRLEGVARHASTHACGVVITAEPLVASVPLQRASAADATIVTQYEMHAVEDLGLLKMDFLGLSNLSIIEHAVNMIRSRGEVIDVDNLLLTDAETFSLLQRGETTGVFQLESGGMKRYLKELKPSEFEDIIAMVSLYRPGPMELIPEYIDRKFGRKPVTYLHPKLETILKRTYGIMVYQEQLMSLARDLAGFTMSEADTLRKAVGKKIKKLLDEQREKLVQGMVAHGIMSKIAAKIWEWIEPFARYGFNRSHGACYALIAYQTAYLKAHYPTEFMAALLTSERGSTDRLAVLIQECREMGITVLGPDVNESDVLFTVVDADSSHPPTPPLPKGSGEMKKSFSPSHREGEREGVGTPAIRFGLAAVKNVGEHLVEVLVAERKANGPYRDLADLLRRMQDKDFNKKSLECLIKSGSLDCFAERGQLLASIDALLAFARSAAHDAASKQANLFGGSSVRADLRLMAAEPTPQRMRLAWEKELLGLYLSSHPFESTATALGSGIVPIAALKTPPSPDKSEGQGRHGEQAVTFGGVITRVKRIVTKGGEGMLFSEIEDHTGSIEAVVFPRVLTATASAWIAETVILVRGKLSDRDGVPKVLADHVVAIVPGREAEALRAVGGETPQAFSSSFREGAQGGDAQSVQPRVVLRLPNEFPPNRLIELKAKLLTTPGPTPVLLRTTAGRSIATGVRVVWTPELRVMVEELLGHGAVVEEAVEVVS